LKESQHRNNGDSFTSSEMEQTMANSFSRSIRSMHRDQFLPGVISLVLLSVVLALWMAWFFWGSLPVYQTTGHYRVMENSTLLASFPEEVRSQFRPGQPATLEMPDGSLEETIHAEVMRIPTRTDDPVELFLLSSGQIQDNGSGQVKVLTGNISPAELMWNSIQK
jgi:hypothetical protein